MNTYQLRLRLTGYETGYLQEYLKTYLDRIHRNAPQTAFEIPHLEVSHPILYIDSEETTEIPAFCLFTFTVDLSMSSQGPVALRLSTAPNGIKRGQLHDGMWEVRG